MSIRPIVLAPDPILKVECKPVARVDDDVRALLNDMLETMYDAPGIGLAAPQIAVDARVLVMDVAREGEPPEPLKLANPEVTWESDALSVYHEGCLSLPEFYGDVERPAAVKIRYLDEFGETQELDADGLLATCVQHEIDHLNGVLFVDHLSKLKRDLILRKMRKLKKERARSPEDDEAA